jgi:hypothetical protein
MLAIVYSAATDYWTMILETKRDLFLSAGKPNQRRRIEDSCSLFTLRNLVAENKKKTHELLLMAHLELQSKKAHLLPGEVPDPPCHVIQARVHLLRAPHRVRLRTRGRTHTDRSAHGCKLTNEEEGKQAEIRSARSLAVEQSRSTLRTWSQVL